MINSLWQTYTPHTERLPSRLRELNERRPFKSVDNYTSLCSASRRHPSGNIIVLVLRLLGHAAIIGLGAKKPFFQLAAYIYTTVLLLLLSSPGSHFFFFFFVQSSLCHRDNASRRRRNVIKDTDINLYIYIHSWLAYLTSCSIARAEKLIASLAD